MSTQVLLVDVNVILISATIPFDLAHRVWSKVWSRGTPQSSGSEMESGRSIQVGRAPVPLATQQEGCRRCRGWWNSNTCRHPCVPVVVVWGVWVCYVWVSVCVVGGVCVGG